MNTTLYYNGTIITLDKDNKVGSCLLVKNNKVHGIFNSPDECKNINNVIMIDLQGKTIIPGFNDNHIHLIFLGDSLKSLHFTDLNEKQIVSLLQKRFSKLKKNEIVYGYDWDYPSCTDPGKEMLDKYFPDNPVLLSQYGGHCYWVNSVTLKNMKIGIGSADPKEGIVCRDENGEPTGIIKDIRENTFLDSWYISRLINRKKNEINYLTALEKCKVYGITSVQDNTWSFSAMMILKQLYRVGKLTARISCWSYGESFLFRLLFNLQQFRKGWYEKGPVKFFIDGTFSGRTAWLLEPYSGSNENCGFGKPKEKIISILEKEIKRKNQCAFHAIGDKAVKEFLDVIEDLSGKYDYIPKLRIRLEHAQLISTDDIQRIKDLGIIISAQPSALNNKEKDISILGKERAEKAYPYKSLLDSGVPLSFGSDAPGEKSFNPFEGIHNTVNRDGKEKISVLDALKCYTIGSAYTEFKEKQKGYLSPGMTADFLVLSDNPLAIKEKQIKNIVVEKTFVDGILIYDITSSAASVDS